MRVEITEKALRSSGYNLSEGDIITVPDDVGTEWCGHGWAKDMDGNVPTGERIVRGAVVQPHTSSHATTDSNEG